MRNKQALLVLSDGTTFEGEAVGASRAISTGEVVFNTAMTGYQEILSDPSYAGQIITFTYPHIGNYGVTEADTEGNTQACRGVIVRELARRHSNWRATASLASFLEDAQIAGIASVDTRRLTRHIRKFGAMTGAFGPATSNELLDAANAEPGTDGVDLVATVSTPEAYEHGDGPWRVVAFDFGIKRSIVAQLGHLANVLVVPASASVEQVMEFEPDGIFLSNGPGDPRYVADAPQTIASLLGKLPLFGICLGHQILSLALGGEITKLPFGHHGANHPIRNLKTGVVEITSQNHNFATADSQIPDAEVSHRNLNDGSIEGLTCTEVPAFSVQHHPEASPGPHDSRYLFGEFDALMAKFHGRKGAF